MWLGKALRVYLRACACACACLRSCSVSDDSPGFVLQTSRGRTRHPSPPPPFQLLIPHLGVYAVSPGHLTNTSTYSLALEVDPKTLFLQRHSHPHCVASCLCLRA